MERNSIGILRSPYSSKKEKNIMVSAISSVSHSAQRAYATQVQEVLSQNRRQERQAIEAIASTSPVYSGQVQAETKPKEEKKTEQPNTQYAAENGRGKSVNIVV